MVAIADRLDRDTQEDGLSLIYIDRCVRSMSHGCDAVNQRCLHRSHLTHEVTSPQAFEGLFVAIPIAMQ